MNYKKSRDLAWEILIENNVSSLPIDLKQICKSKNISLFPYSQSKQFISDLDLEEHIKDNDAFSLGSTIFYDDTKPTCRQRFSIAHELGHIFLHMNKPGSITTQNKEPSDFDDPIETEANIFASRLLAPLCVLQFLNLNSAKEISEYCDISYTAAKHRFSRLCEIRKRSSQRKAGKNHGTFLLSKLERQVIRNFEKYLEENKKEPSH